MGVGWGVGGDNYRIYCKSQLKLGIGTELSLAKIEPSEYPLSVYVGESFRSLYEKGVEYWKDFKNKAENSHFYKHHILKAFHLRPVKFTKTVLSRQLSETVRIERLGEEHLLNSKSEYNCYKVGRLTMED